MTGGLAATTALLLRRGRARAKLAQELSASAEAERRAANHMRDLLLAGASHDLKTPLATIRLLTHLI